MLELVQEVEDVVAFITGVCGNSGLLCVQRIGEIIGMKRCDYVLTP